VQSRVGGQVARDYADAWVQCSLSRNEFGRELATDGCSAKYAGIEMKELHGVPLGGEGLNCVAAFELTLTETKTDWMSSVVLGWDESMAPTVPGISHHE